MLFRWMRHAIADLAVNRRFPRPVLEAIERAVADQERRHGGQLRFAIEGSLDPASLVRGLSARERALEVFARLRVWDTEHNSGVLLYVLLGDRAVEIVADRGIRSKVSQDQWESICRLMEARYSQGDFAGGSIAGIERAGDLLAAHFPATAGGQMNELPDQPAVL
jgi:uncharacterized membrane protein